VPEKHAHSDQNAEVKCISCNRSLSASLAYEIAEHTYLCKDCHIKMGFPTSRPRRLAELKKPPPKNRFALQKNVNRVQRYVSKPAVILFMIVMLGFYLRISGLDFKSLWLDEVYSVWFSGKDIPSMLNTWEMIANPPLYYIIVHFILGLDNSEFVVRLPSAVFGVLSIVIVYKIGELLFGKKEGLVSAFLLSISTMHIQYSQMARAYSLFAFLSLLSLFFFHKAVKENNKKLWIGFTASTTLAIYTHYYAFLIVLIEMLFLVFMVVKNRGSRDASKVKRSFLTFILTLIIISVLFLPLLKTWLSLEGGNPSAVVGGTLLRSREWGLSPTPAFFEGVFSSFSGATGPLLYIFIIIFLCGLFASFKKYREQTVLLLLWFTIPVSVLFVLSFVTTTSTKYIIFALPVYIVIISKGIVTIENSVVSISVRRFTAQNRVKKSIRLGLVVLTTIILLFGMINAISLQKYYAGERENWRGAANYLETNSLANDIIIIEPDYTMECLLYYFNNFRSNLSAMDNPGARILTKENVTIASTGGSLMTLKDVCSRFNAVWFVSSGHTQFADPREKIRNWVNEKFIEIEEFGSVAVHYYAKGLIKIPLNKMRFYGLDSAPDKDYAAFSHNGDNTTFKVTISEAGNYDLLIYAKSGGASGASAVELVVDGVSKGTSTFSLDEWSIIKLGTFYLNAGLHEIRINNREGGALGNTAIKFKFFAFLSSIQQLKIRSA